MKWGKIIWATAAAFVIRYIISSGFGGLFQNLYDPISGLWRAMLTPSWFQNVLIGNLILAFFAVLAYSVVHTGLGKKSQITKKGLKFGLILWILRDVTGAIMTYVFMPVSLAVVSTWVLSGLVISLVNGQVIARIYR